MTEENNMKILILLVLLGLFIYAAISLSKKWLPKTATQPFKSFSEIKVFYLSSISIMRNKLWLLLLPLGLVLSQNLIYWFFTFKSSNLSLTNISEEEINIANTLLDKTFLFSLIKSFFHIPENLDYGFNHSISYNIIYLSFFLICLLTYKGEIKRLKKYSTDENLTNVSFIKTILKSSLLILLGSLSSAGVLFFISPDGLFRIFCYSFIGVSIFALGLSSLSIFSLLEGYILFSVKDAVQSKNSKPKKIFNEALAVIKPLFTLNIVLYSVGALSSLMMLPTTISQFFGLKETIPYSVIVFFQNASNIYSYFFSFLMIFVFCVPFTLINYKGSAYNAFKNTISFIKDFLVKYSFFVCSGITLLFLPTFIDSCLSQLVAQYSIQAFLINIFTTSLRVTLAVVFYIAMYNFIYYNSKTEVLKNRT